MTLAIVGSFIACWTPYFVVHLVHIWSEYQHKIPQAVFALADTVALVNSAVNPLLYVAFTLRCRKRLKAVCFPACFREQTRSSMTARERLGLPIPRVPAAGIDARRPRQYD